MLGDKGYGIGAHFSEHLVVELEGLDHDVEFMNEIRTTKKLSELNEDFDLIFIDQCDGKFINDVDCQVFYNHKYFHRDYCVDKADVIFFLNSGMRYYFEKYKDISMYHYHELLECSVDPMSYKPLDKTLKGVNGLGYRRSFEDFLKFREIINSANILMMRRDVRDFIESGFMIYESPITDIMYRELLSKCEATFFPIPYVQYTTRRIFEAMACKTACFLKFQDEFHESILKEHGLLNNEHYVGINEISEIHEKLWDIDLEYIANNAFEVTMKNHLYVNRVREIVRLYEERA